MSEKQAIENIQARLNELKNVLRIVQNAFNLIADVDVKGAHCNAVGEIMGWLNGFGKTLQTQISALEATLPKEKPEDKADGNVTVIHSGVDIKEAKV